MTSCTSERFPYRVTLIDASGLFEVMEDEIDDLNIEGAFVKGSHLSLMHRGNKRHAVNAIVNFDLESVLSSIERDESIGKARIERLKEYDLGAVDNVPYFLETALSTQLN